MPERETWRNTSRGKRGVVKFDRFGNIVHELVGPDRTVVLTRDERLLNQERAANDRLDIFKNGVMVPVKLIDPEDEREFAENPNILTEEGIRDLFKLHVKKFEKALNEITNPFVLERMKDLAENDETLDVSVKKVQLVNARIQSVNPNAPVEVEVISAPDGA